MNERSTPLVGRTWYLEIRQGVTSSQAFLGTRHPATGDQLWHRMDWGTSFTTLTESEILDELWAAAMSFMEARTHLA
jgi:hypothetical protein